MSLQFATLEPLKERLIHIEDELKEAIKRVNEIEKISQTEDINALLKKANEISAIKKTWSREMIAHAGNRLMEECRAEAIAKGIAIKDEREATIGD
ncbi:MAG: hypothetical protein ABIF11_05095 [Nitrospirota bacterium]